ncbi:helix-turn-helix domain-containing protein [Streptomyces albiaxialis]|uniref:Helix-turn-helix domain-containing protein n=1 Tax=Streptomyces albiaxialis TaxID=329523 RepID=A0ABN2W6P7_9ACTN
MTQDHGDEHDERDEQSRTISDPESLKALAHPLRLKILRQLGTSGSATATTLATALGENTGTLSYHLRQLERGGFIEDDPAHTGGRERWWRAVRGLDVRMPADEGLTPAEKAVLGELDRMRAEEDLALARRFAVEGRSAEGWMRGSRSLSHLTREELDAFHDAYLELVRRFSRGPEEARPDTRPVALRWFGIPVDEPGGDGGRRGEEESGG